MQREKITWQDLLESINDEDEREALEDALANRDEAKRRIDEVFPRKRFSD